MAFKKNFILATFLMIFFFSQSANALDWYNESNFNYRYKVSLPSNYTEDIVFPFKTPNGNVIWTETTTEQLYLYCNMENCSDLIAVANSTSLKRFENAKTATGNKKEEMWQDHGFSLVFHMNVIEGDIPESTGTGDFISPPTYNLTNGTLDGVIYSYGNLTGAGETNCYDIANTGLVTGNDDRTTIGLLYNYNNSISTGIIQYGSNTVETAFMVNADYTDKRMEIGFYGAGDDWTDTSINVTTGTWEIVTGYWDDAGLAGGCKVNSTITQCNSQSFDAVNSGFGYYDSAICPRNSSYEDEVFHLNVTKTNGWLQNFSYAMLENLSVSGNAESYSDTIIEINYPENGEIYTESLNNSEIYVYDRYLATFPVKIYNNNNQIYSSDTYSNGSKIGIDLETTYEDNTITVIVNGTNNRTDEITYYLTEPKLNIIFSDNTSGFVAHLGGGYNFTGTSVLLVQGNISTGYVSVLFNGNKQMYEYYNDQLTHINETMDIIETDEVLNIRISDKSAGIIEGATVRISRLNSTNYTLIFQGISNEEGVVQLNIIDGEILKVEVLKSGYVLYYSIINSYSYSGADNYYAVKLQSTNEMFYNNVWLEATHTNRIYVFPLQVSIIGFSFSEHEYCFKMFSNEIYEGSTCYTNNEANYSFTLENNLTEYIISCYVDDIFEKNFTFTPSVYTDRVEDPEFYNELQELEEEKKYQILYFPFIIILVFVSNILKNYKREALLILSLFFTAISISFLPILICGFIMLLAKMTKEARGKG